MIMKKMNNRLLYAGLILLVSACTIEEFPVKTLKGGDGVIYFTVENEDITTKTHIGVNEEDNIFTTYYGSLETFRFGAYHSYEDQYGTRNLKYAEGCHVITQNPYYFKANIPSVEPEDTPTLEAVYLLVSPGSSEGFNSSSRFKTSDDISTNPVDNVLSSFYFGPDRKDFNAHSSQYMKISGGYDPRWDYVKNNGALPDSDGGKVPVYKFTLKRPTSLLYFHINTPLDEKILSAKLVVDGDPIACDSIQFGVRTVADTLQPYCELAGSRYNSITETFTPNYKYERADDFRIFFNVLPGSYSSISLEITTQSKKATLTRQIPGNFVAGCLSKAVLDLSNDVWQSNGNTLYRIGGMEFVVPDGALGNGSISEDSGFWGKDDLDELTVNEDSTKFLPMERENFLGAVDLLPHGLEFADSVTVTVPMSTTTSKDMIDVQYYDEENDCWSPENEAVVNHEENTITFKVKHFSRYTYSDQDNLLKILIATLKRGLREGADDESLGAMLTRTVDNYFPQRLGTYYQHRWFMETLDASTFKRRAENPQYTWGYTFGDYEIPEEDIHYFQKHLNNMYWYGLYFTMSARYPRQLQSISFNMSYECAEGSGTISYVYPIQSGFPVPSTPSMDALFSDPYFVTKYEWMSHESETLFSIMHSAYRKVVSDTINGETTERQESFSWNAQGMYRCESPSLH